jgi:hypothetical protein
LILRHGINFELVVKVVNIEMGSNNTSQHLQFYYFPRHTMGDYNYPLEGLSFLELGCITRKLVEVAYSTS